MIEVYSGSRPGRPGLLLACSAATLLAALALAGLQVRDTRRLGDAVRIPGTPLIVRPPHGWQPDPRDSSAFVRTVQVERWGRSTALVERRVRFRYQRWQTFRPTAAVLQDRNFWELYPHMGGERAARVGPFDGVQVVRGRQFDLWGSPQAGSMVYRLAMSPRGEEINVEYIPLGEMSPGDVDLLDEICAHVEIDDPLLSRTPTEILAAAGVAFPIDPAWRIFPPDLPEVQGLYVQGDRGGIPVWAVGLFRTWLSTDRTPEQLLLSFAESIWGVERGSARVDAVRGGDADVYALAVTQPEADEPDLLFPTLVVRDARHAALLFAVADPRFRAEAEAAVDRIATALAFAEAPAPPDIAAAEAAGRALAAALAEGGDLQWTAPDAAVFYGETIQPPQWRHAPRLVSDARERAADGWRGRREYHRLSLDSRAIELEREEEWFFSDDGRSFALQAEDPGRRGAPLVSEQRSPGASAVVRTIRNGPSTETLTLPVGAGYVAPPAEGLVEARVAERGDSDVIIELSTLTARSTYWRLLRPLGPHPQGYARVLLLDDYFPRGVVVWYDDEGRMVGQEDPGRRLERADPSRIRALIENWRVRQ